MIDSRRWEGEVVKFELLINQKPAATTHDGLLHGITQEARFTKYADYTTIDGARRCSVGFLDM